MSNRTQQYRRDPQDTGVSTAGDGSTTGAQIGARRVQPTSRLAGSDVRPTVRQPTTTTERTAAVSTGAGGDRRVVERTRPMATTAGSSTSGTAGVQRPAAVDRTALRTGAATSSALQSRRQLASDGTPASTGEAASRTVERPSAGERQITPEQEQRLLALRARQAMRKDSSSGKGGTPNRGGAAGAGAGGDADADANDLAFRRRPSQLVLDREKKTEYWQDVATEAQKAGTKLSGDELNNVISRAMSLGIVGDRKTRESLSGPKAAELFEKLKETMTSRVAELSGGKVQNVEQLSSQNATLLDKVITLERTLTELERRKTMEEEEEKKKVQSKITELERSLRALETQKREQREQNRRTMKLEISNLKEMMAKVQKDQAVDAAASNEAKTLGAKMNRLEAALRLMNEERKKDKPDDKETVLLRRKLALFEQKLKEMEEEKKLKDNEDQNNSLRDKLLLMEDKLSKMERRKSMSMTMVMQQKMEQVEKQLTMLRQQKENPGTDVSNSISQKMTMLEKQLKEMSSQKITPSMINDEETVQLRTYIQKLEGSITSAEKKMEDQRKRIEEERKMLHEKRQREEEEFRRQARQKEEELLKRIQQMESRIKAGGGGGGGLDPSILNRLQALETGGGSLPSDVGNKIAEMEKKLHETQRALEEERNMTKSFLDSAPKGSDEEVESWKKDAQIKWLQQTNRELFQKLEATNSLIDKKMEEFKSMKFSGGGAVHKSGLSYEEINVKLAEIQGQLFDPNTDERESERLNIEYEKLISELEQTPEYQKEQDELKNKWKNENAPINKAAFERVIQELNNMGDQKLTQHFGRKPELRLAMRTPEQISKMHVNDFLQLSTQNLSEDEARALYHNMPPFKKEQAKQLEWCQQLQAKIELEMSKPKTKAPPPIPKKKTIVIKKKKESGGGGGGFLDELLAKRKRRD